MKFRSEKAKADYLEEYERYESAIVVGFESLYVDTPPYGITYVRASGSSGNEPLLLLPGAHTNSLMWYKNIEQLSEHYRVYAIDPIYDHGKSETKIAASTPYELVSWLNVLITGLSINEKFHLCGMSLGGWVSAKFALHEPDKIKTLILLAPAATVHRISLEFLVRAIAGCTIPMKKATYSFANWVLAPHNQKVQEHDTLVKEFSDILHSAAKNYRIPMKHPIPSRLSDGELIKLSELNTHFVVGELEPMYSADRAFARLKAVSPNIGLNRIPQAGHAFLRSHSSISNQVILSCLSGL